MTAIREQISAYVDANAGRLVEELQRFLRQPSISTVNQGMEECVDMLREELEGLGLKTELLQVEGAFPAVFARSPKKGEKKELFVYNHYDVQDPDPLDQWASDPFGAEIRDGYVYARGATDDKGNLYANMKALEVLKELLGEVPPGIKLFVEGEEEIGSPNLERYLSRFADELHADGAVACDRGVHESGRPQMYLGCKGMVRAEISCRRAKRDVHSGQAPLIPNAAWDLLRLLNSMMDENHHITIPGYLDAVQPPTEEELALIGTIPMDLGDYKAEYAVNRLVCGDKDGEELVKELLYRPTCNISGIKSGWTGERGKTIVPCDAWVRLDLRLIKDMTAEEAAKRLEAFVKASPYGPFEVTAVPSIPPYKVPPNDELVQLAGRLAKEVYGRDPVVWPYLDGTAPFGLFPRYIGGDIFVIGLGAPFATANTHAPNENISIEQYLTGIKYMANIFYEYLC